MAELVVDLFVGWVLLVGLFFLLSRPPRRPERLSGQPQPFPPAAFPLNLETAERMIEWAYDRNPSRRMSGGERHHPPSREDAD
jgi:hypothetical protein